MTHLSLEHASANILSLTPPPSRSLSLSLSLASARISLQAYADLSSHILRKAVQAGGVFGASSSLLLAALRPQYRHTNALLRTAGLVTLGVGGAAAVAGLAKVATLDRDGVNDRIYRLHFNQGQIRVDTFSAVGGTIGLVAAAAMTTGPASFAQVVGGLGWGAALSVGAHVISSRLLESEEGGMKKRD